MKGQCGGIMDFIPISYACRNSQKKTNAERSGDDRFSTKADLKLWWRVVRKVPFADIKASPGMLALTLITDTRSHVQAMIRRLF